MSAHPIGVCVCKGSEIFWIEQENSLLLAIFCAELIERPNNIRGNKHRKAQVSV